MRICDVLILRSCEKPHQRERLLMKSSWAIERESLLAKQRQITDWEGVGERVGRRRHVSGGRGACCARGGACELRAQLRAWRCGRVRVVLTCVCRPCCGRCCCVQAHKCPGVEPVGCQAQEASASSAAELAGASARAAPSGSASRRRPAAVRVWLAGAQHVSRALP